MTESKRATGSDLAKVDDHVIAPAEYDEIPDLSTDEWARKAKPPSRGRPKSADPKQQVTLRIDRDVLEALRASGPGWQSRVNEALRSLVDRSAV